MKKTIRELLTSLYEIRETIEEINMDETFCEIESHEEFVSGDFSLADAMQAINNVIRGVTYVEDFEKGRSFYRHGNRILVRNRAFVVRRFSVKFRAGYVLQRTQATNIALARRTES